MELTTNEKVNNLTNQQAYVLYYTFDNLPRDIKKLPIRITYSSKKLKAVYFYTDVKVAPKIAHTLKKYHGGITFEPAPLFVPALNF